MLSKQVFTEAMIELSAQFKKENSSEIFYQSYYTAIRDISDEACKRAVKYLVKFHDSQFFPIPSSFLQAVRDSTPEPTITPQEKRIEPNYTGCPPETKEFIKGVIEKIKKRGMK